MTGRVVGGIPTLDPHVRDLRRSATIAIQARSVAMQKEGRRVYRLGLGQSPFPVPSAVVDALRANAAQKDYLPVEGLPSLRDAVAEYHRRRNDLAVTGCDVLVGPGSKELMFLLQLVYQGEIVIPTPAWVSYAPQARILGREVVFLPKERERSYLLDPAQLDAHCRRGPPRPRLLVVNSPSNPTGCSYSAAELEALAEVARRHEMIVLSDEIYGELHFRGQHVSLARFYPEGTIVSSGLSKWCGAGGWRLGTFSFPPQLRWLLDAMASVASETYTTTSSPIQHAAVRAFQGGASIERYLVAARRVVAALGLWTTDSLRAAGLALPTPTGAFYVFADAGAHRESLAARGMRTSAEVTERLLLETGVAVLPGVDFGRPEEELTMRLALVDFDGGRALQAALALRSDDPFAEAHIFEYCRPTAEAVQRIGAFVRGEA